MTGNEMKDKLGKLKTVFSDLADKVNELSGGLLDSSEKRPYCTAVVLAAGSSVRMGEDKTEMDCGGMPVFIRTLKAFEAAESVDEIILVTREEKITEMAERIACTGLKKVRSVITGGSTRAESSLAGVMAVNKKAEIIAIHDCARPFVSERIINESVEAAERYYAAAPAVPCVDTLKIREGEFVRGSVDRDSLCRIQTPQVFQADIIKGALTYVVQHALPVTDDTSAVEYLGYRTKLVEGDAENIKLTTKDDLAYADVILARRGEKT